MWSKMLIKNSLIVASIKADLFTTKRLLSSASKLKYSPIWINPYQSLLPLPSSLKASGNALYFHRSTGTNYDDFDLLVTQAHQDAGFIITNNLTGLKQFRSKDEQFLFFSRHNLSCIPTLFYRGPMNDDLINRLKNFKTDKYILKMVRGNQGIGVNLFESQSSLLGMLETFTHMRDQRFLIQPFIEHRREWRLFYCGDKLLAAVEKKTAKNEYRNNAKRAHCKLIKKLPHELSALGQEAFSQSGLDYAGIDVLEDKTGCLRLLEINSVPGFEQVEELSGLDMARELIVNAATNYKR